MVAGGGGGSDYYQSGSNGGAAGGLTAYSGGYYGSSGYTVSTGGTQVSGGIGGKGAATGGSGTFGIGGSATNTGNHGGGGGGGYYGGGSGSYNNSVVGSGAGGSSYVSGHTGSVAIKSDSDTSARLGTDSVACTTGTTDNLCSIHYSSKFFSDTVMIDGTGYSWTNVKGEQAQMPNPSGGSYSLGVGHTGNGYARITPISYYNIFVDNGKTYGKLPVVEKDGYKFAGWSTVEDNYNTLVTEDSIVNAKTAHTLYALYSPI